MSASILVSTRLRVGVGGSLPSDQFFFKGFKQTIHVQIRGRDLPAYNETHISVGSLVKSTEESIAPYDSDSTPRDFKLLMCDSVSRRKSFKFWSDVTASTVNSVSMCFEIISCL